MHIHFDICWITTSFYSKEVHQEKMYMKLHILSENVQVLLLVLHVCFMIYPYM